MRSGLSKPPIRPNSVLKSLLYLPPCALERPPCRSLAPASTPSRFPFYLIATSRPCCLLHPVRNLGDWFLRVSVVAISSQLLIPLTHAADTTASCRGSVSGWIPAEEVRKYLDEKLRTCSHDSCKFVGTYEQLREHARLAHLLTKPVHVDISRKRTWDLLEREQEFGDVISAIRSQNPGAIIVGDYVIETRDAMSPDEDSGEESGDDWWSPLQDPVESPNERLGSASIWENERHVLPRFLPQPRPSFIDRRSSRTDWQGIRRSRTQSLLRQGFSSQHPRHSSSYRRYRHTILDRHDAGIRRTGMNRRQDDATFVPSRRQRLRYTQRRQHDP